MDLLLKNQRGRVIPLLKNIDLNFYIHILSPLGDEKSKIKSKIKKVKERESRGSIHQR